MTGPYQNKNMQPRMTHRKQRQRRLLHNRMKVALMLIKKRRKKPKKKKMRRMNQAVMRMLTMMTLFRNLTAKETTPKRTESPRFGMASKRRQLGKAM